MLELPPNFDREAQLQQKATGLHELDGVSRSFLQIAPRMQQLKIEYFMRPASSKRHDMVDVILDHFFTTGSTTTSLLEEQRIYLRPRDSGYFWSALSSSPPLLRIKSNFVLIFGSPFSVVFSLVHTIVLFVFIAPETRIIAELLSISLSVFTSSFHESCVIQMISFPFQLQKSFLVGVALFFLSGRVTNKTLMFVKPRRTAPWIPPAFLAGRLFKIPLKRFYCPTDMAFPQVDERIRLNHKCHFLDLV